jgi:Integrase core domain
MTDGYDCCQNALAERVDGTLKAKYFLSRPSNPKQARRLVVESIQIYNRERPHLSLKMQTPDAVHRASITALPVNCLTVLMCQLKSGRVTRRFVPQVLTFLTFLRLGWSRLACPQRRAQFTARCTGSRYSIGPASEGLGTHAVRPYRRSATSSHNSQESPEVAPDEGR